MQATENIRYLADVEAEKRWGINAHARLLQVRGDLYLFEARLMPDYQLGHLVYDARRARFI